MLGGLPDNPGVHILLADDEAVHEEDTQQQQHATSIGHHNLARGCGYQAVQVQPNLVNQEQQGKEHEEPAATVSLLKPQQTSSDTSLGQNRSKHGKT